MGFAFSFSQVGTRAWMFISFPSTSISYEWFNRIIANFLMGACVSMALARIVFLVCLRYIIAFFFWFFGYKYIIAIWTEEDYHCYELGDEWLGKELYPAVTFTVGKWSTGLYVVFFLAKKKRTQRLPRCRCSSCYPIFVRKNLSQIHLMIHFQLSTQHC